MRARVYSNGGNSTGGFTFIGGQMTGALILAGNPSDPLEAASKQYVDSLLVNLNASNLSTGTLPSARLPSFAGDVVKPAGSSSINLAPNGVTAGDYIKPSVDAKGRVTGGSTLVNADIPNLNWDKISTGKPTTLNGYGITNAISTSGGSLSGFLSFSGSIIGNMQAVTKQYIDVTLSSSSGIAIGDIIRKPYTTTPAGFLKCNGGMVDKTTYNALYSIINDRFNKEKQFTSGHPWTQQYNINFTQNDDITNWNTYTSLSLAVCSAQAIVTKNRVYLIGGLVAGGTVQATVFTAPINNDGSLGAWVAGTALPGVLAYSSSTIIKNRVYLFGGTTDGNNSVTTVYTTNINTDGTLGTWVTGTALPSPVANSYLVVTNSRVYVLGGNNNTSLLSTVYYAVINSDGTLGAWVTGTALPEAIYAGSAIVTKNRVYLIGGKNAAGSLITTYTAVINSDGSLGSWSTGTSLPAPVWTHAVFVSRNRVYTFGGTTGAGTIVKTVYTAVINADGTLGVWTIGTSIPVAMQQTSSIVVKNKIYLLGAYGLTSVYVANISGGLNDYSSYYAEDTTNYMMPGSGKPWQQQYQLNTTQVSDITGWSAGTALPGALQMSSVVVTKNRVYLLGGYSGSNAVSTVYTAPINSDGTLGTWTTGTALPGVLAESQAIVTKNRVYLCGGFNATVYISTVYTAPINSDGTLGAWTTGTSLPGVLAISQAIVTKNRVYLLGGYDGAAPVTVMYTVSINADGTLGSWSTSLSLPDNRYGSQAIVTKNRVYLCGGHNGSTWLATICTATINSDGTLGPWTTGTSLPGVLYKSQVFITKNRVYLIGGQTASNNAVSTVYTALINADGTLGTWTTGTSLPGVLAYSSIIVTKNHIYLCGGNIAATVVNTVYMASILGGENDYSPYYDGTITPVIPVDQSTNFALPDLSSNEKFDTVSYIKY